MAEGTGKKLNEKLAKKKLHKFEYNYYAIR